METFTETVTQVYIRYDAKYDNCCLPDTYTRRFATSTRAVTHRLAISTKIVAHPYDYENRYTGFGDTHENRYTPIRDNDGNSFVPETVTRHLVIILKLLHTA